MQETTSVAQTKRRESVYDAVFFDHMVDGALESARVIVPLVMRLVEPKSVVDVGCGIGAWLKIVTEQGVEDILGLDGEYVDCSRLLIDPNCFQKVDLQNPQALSRSFDLATCLEVGEHLPARSAPSLVKLLVDAAPLVLFSAAVPGQGGTHHVNEQWPQYWQNLFAQHGYEKLDPFRRHICFDRRVRWWYRQNIYLYASQEAINNSEVLKKEVEWAKQNDMEILHSSLFVHQTYLSGLLRLIPGTVRRAIKNAMTTRRRKSPN